MAINWEAPVQPTDLTEFVRRVPLPNELKLSALFPTVIKDTNKVNFSEITKRNRTARFRSFDGRIHVADRDGYTDSTIDLPPLSDSRNVGEYERLQQEMMRLGGTRLDALQQAIYDDGEELTRYVRNRMELAVGDVLTDGVLTLDELGGVATDFGVAAGNKPAASVAWTTTATADVLGDLVAWCDAYELINGFRPGGLITSRRVARLAQINTKLINAVRGAQTGVTRVSLEDAANVFDGEGIPSNWTIYETMLDVDGVDKRPIPDDRIVFLPPNPADLLEIRYGLTATALELLDAAKTDFAFSNAPGIVGVVIKEGPPFRKYTFVDAVGMPILKDAKKLFVPEVF